MSVDLSIITVTWNSASSIKEQLISTSRAAQNLNFEQIVVDNASRDNTALIVKEFPQVRLIENPRNIGFGRSNNLGAAMANGEFILFLNPDIKFLSGNLISWVNWMRSDSGIGVSGCKLVDRQGNIKKNALPRRFPTWQDQLLTAFKLPHVLPRLLGKYLYHDLDFSKEQEVDTVRGSAMLVRRELLNKLGRSFDPRFFVWFEDVDLCREAKRLGYRVVYNPALSCVDYLGQSFAKRNLFWKQWQYLKSMIKYFGKWGRESV